MHLPEDNHTHTALCKHATGAPAAYVEAARRLGLPRITFTDHAPTPDGYDPDCRMAMDQFPEYVRSVRACAGRQPPRVGLGIEADYYEGCERFLSGWLDAGGFDVVLGSVHYIGDWPFDSQRGMDRWPGADVARVWQAYFDLVARMAKTRLFDVVTHLDLPKKFGHRLPPGEAREMCLPALEAVAAAGMALEINTAGLRRPAAEIYPSAELLSAARPLGIPICFGSDAHAPGEVGFEFARAVRLAQACGYTQCVGFRGRRMVRSPLPACGDA